MKNDFIPGTYSNIISMEKNFIEKFRTYAVILNLSTEEVNETIEILNRHLKSYSEMISKKAESKAATEFHKEACKESRNELRRITKLIKSSKKYTTAIGDALGIIGSEIPKNNLFELKPYLTAKSVGELVKIKFRKNRAEGINIYSKRGDETKFTFLSSCKFSPFTDERSKIEITKPEHRFYYAFFTGNGKDVGVKSDEIRVTIS